MSTTYQQADEDVLDLLQQVKRDHHPRLAEAGVEVGIIMALNPDDDAIKAGGYPAFAQIKVVSLKDRVSKGYDAELLIDERKWRELTAAQRVALLDHELSHVDRVDVPERERGLFDESAGPVVSWKTDDRGRPKLRTVNGDWHCGDAFAEVIRRHGDSAIEYMNLAFAKGRADAGVTCHDPSPV